MPTLDVELLNNKILDFIQQHLKKNINTMDIKLTDIGFESIDYISLATFLFEITGEWLDISKLTNDTRIFDIPSHLIPLAIEKTRHKKMVKLGNWQRYTFSFEMNPTYKGAITCIIHYLWLKENVDLSKLKRAIEETLNHHFMLSCKLIRQIDDYYFECTDIQEDFIFKGSLLFPQKDRARLTLRVSSDRLVSIYLQRKNNQDHLIISFHHIALDGWAYAVIQEEIFRRYAGLYQPKKNESAEICALNSTYTLSLQEQSNPSELASIFESIDPYEYNKMDYLFQGKLHINYDCFVISKEQIDQYALKNNINGFSYDVIFTFMYYHMMNELFSIDKLLIYTTLSNRYLPIVTIKELATNIATGLPLFLHRTSGAKEFTTDINETLKIYFKHMSFGAISRILLENNTILNEFLSISRRPYYLLLTYINNTSKIIYGNDSIISQYVNLEKSKTLRELKVSKRVFLAIYNLGSEFLIELNSRMPKRFHQAMVSDFFGVHFPK